MTLEIQPITYAEACEFIRCFHRHHLPPQGWKFGVAVNDGERVCGVVTVGRPVARRLDDGWTLELTRCCTDGTPNAASMLYGAARRAAFALGYKRLITYTLDTEPGTSLKAAGWKLLGVAGGGDWNKPSRPRQYVGPQGQKHLWEAQQWQSPAAAQPAATRTHGVAEAVAKLSRGEPATVAASDAVAVREAVTGKDERGECAQ